MEATYQPVEDVASEVIGSLAGRLAVTFLTNM